jgi:hypothetical protein
MRETHRGPTLRRRLDALTKRCVYPVCPCACRDGLQRFISSPNCALFYAHHAFIDKVYREWEQASSANVFSGASLDTVMNPWGRTARRVLSEVTPCVQYASDGTGARAALASLPPDTARKAAADAEAAARLFGASQARIDAARATMEEVLSAQGISLNATAA